MHRKLASAALRGGAAAVDVDDIRDAVEREVRDTERHDRPADALQRPGDDTRTRDRRNHREMHAHRNDEPHPGGQRTGRRVTIPAIGRPLDRERDPVREQNEPERGPPRTALRP